MQYYTTILANRGAGMAKQVLSAGGASTWFWSGQLQITAVVRMGLLRKNLCSSKSCGLPACLSYVNDQEWSPTRAQEILMKLARNRQTEMVVWEGTS